MRFSRFFIPTTKEKPSDATLLSHQYLVRGGFINQEGAGLYNFLPLGKIVLEKIRKIVKDELDSIGCNEIQLSFVTPFSLWEESGRAFTMGSEMLRIKDRKNADFVLSPTNEEAVVEVVKNRITSYKNLPINLYQINTKFRDEARPRFGLLRGREFLMKDGYSFHASAECLKKEFDLMEQTYKNIFTKLGLEYRVVDADSGAIGGSGSKEFMVLASSGEDTIVVCNSCEYASNIEAAKRVKKDISFISEPNKTIQKVETIDKKTIDEVSSFLNLPKEKSIKAVIKKAIFENNSQIVVFFIRGDDDLEETKAKNAINALDLVDANEEEIKEVALIAGYVGLVDLPKDVVFMVDNELRDEDDLVCGANEENFHLVNVDLSQISNINYFDLITVKEGDRCICCNGGLSYTKGIEVGHIFQLGTKYSSALKANFLDQQGKSQPFVMGCYGIGISRLVAAVIEQNNDEKGCVWTKATAPFMVDVIVSNAKNEDELNSANKIYEELKSAGIETIIDDRKDERFGFKMGDFELLGFPYAIIFGKKLVDGIVEVVNRKSLEKVEVKLEDVTTYIKNELEL